MTSTTLLNSDRVTTHFLERIPRDFAREHLVVSQGAIASSDKESDESEQLIAPASVSPTIVHNISVRLGCSIQTSFVEPETGSDELIARVIDEAYERYTRGTSGGSSSNNGKRAHPKDGIDAIDVNADGDSSELADSIEHLLARADRELLSTRGKGPIVRLVDQLLFEALGEGASDLHVQPMADGALVRYRIDGVLHDRHELTPRMTLPVVSRIKVMGRMDIAERRIPQDGRSSVTIASRPIDLRISTIPTSYGERAVIRLLDHS